MPRTDEPARTIVPPRSSGDPSRRLPSEDADDSTRNEPAETAPANRASPGDEDRTQFVDHSHFLDDSQPPLPPEERDTLQMAQPHATPPPEERDTVKMPQAHAAPPPDQAEAAPTIMHSAPAHSALDAELRGAMAAAAGQTTPDERTTMGGHRDEGATTFLGAPGGATVIAPALGESPADGGRRTIRPAGSRTIAERGDGSATLAQPGGGQAGSLLAAGAASNHYEFVEPIAEGGMGRIWRAADSRIRREVAFKELLPEALREPEAIERFIEEAQVTGQLEHPGVVPVYELGRQENGTPFYSMKLVVGSTLRDVIQACHELPRESGERRLAFARLLRNLVAVCNAVGFAHERGVLHRDLKPLNIMLGDFGETLVLDWGMAKVLGAPAIAASATPAEATDDDDAEDAEASGDTTRTEFDPSHASGSTQTSIQHSHSHTGHSTRRHSVKTDARSAGTQTQMGSIMGTPNYMAPEQALGLVHEFDARTDIYSLGAILYEILTGRPPVPKGKITEKLKYIIEGRTPPPHEVDPTIPRAIEAICLKAMAKRKDERYQTALALAADVEAFLADEPVSVYAEPWHTRLRRWAKRHRTPVITLAAVMLVTILGWTAWSITDGQRIARIERMVHGNIEQARQAVSDGKLELADGLLRDALGRARGEGELATLTAGVEAQLSHVEQLRLEQTRQLVQENVTAAEAAIQENDDYAAARALLVEARAVAARESGLAPLQAELEGRLKTIEAEMAGQAARQAARDQFARFENLVDEARFHGSLFRGDNVQQDTADAQRLALEALGLYGLEQANALDPPPAHLTPEQVDRLRRDAYELLLLLANAELVLNWDGTADELRTAAEQGLEWIARAGALGIQTRAALQRKAGLLERLGRADELAEARRLIAQTEPSGALDFFLLGEIERQSHRYDDALRWYQRTLQAEPEHFWAMHFSALCHFLWSRTNTRLSPAGRVGELEAAAANLAGCLAQRPKFAWNYLLRGAVYGELRRYDDALADLDMALKLAPEFAGVFVNRGFVLFAQADQEGREELYAAAAADFRRAAELWPGRADPYLSLGELARHRAALTERQHGAVAAAELYQEALAAFTEAVRLAPGAARAYQFRGNVYFRLEQLEAAARDYRRAAELEQNPVQRSLSLVELGRTYHFQLKYQPALESYRDAVESDPQNADAHFYLAETQQALGQHTEAAKSFQTFLELRQAADEAAEGGDQRVQAEPFMLAKAFRMRGELSASQRDYRHAMEDYIRAAERNPASFETLSRRGWAYLTQGARLAEADFDDAIRLNPSDADHWAGRGYARVVQGRYQDAVQDAAKAAELAAEQIADGNAQGWSLLFNPATIYAQAVHYVGQDASLEPEERSLRADEFARRAIELLQEAERAAGAAGRQGFQATLQGDQALDPIRNRPDFQDLWGPKPAN